MGVLSGVFLAPVRLVTWTAEQVRDAAEARLYDESAIRDQLVQLNRAYDEGAIDDTTFQASEDVLMDRLEAARERRRR